MKSQCSLKTPYFDTNCYSTQKTEVILYWNVKGNMLPCLYVPNGLQTKHDPDLILRHVNKRIFRTVPLPI